MTRPAAPVKSDRAARRVFVSGQTLDPHARDIFRSVPAIVLAAFLIVPTLHAERRRAVQKPLPPPTFSGEVVRIFQKHCQECHRPDGLAPFSLLRYAEAAKRAAMIDFMVEARKMPPWKPVDGCRELVGSRALSPREIATIKRWVNTGAAEGDARDLPPDRTFDSAWRNGPPDIDLGLDELFTPPARSDTFRCFVLSDEVESTEYFSAVDFLPVPTDSIHHAIAYVDTSGEGDRLDQSDPEPGYSCIGGPGFIPAGLLGGWFPGASPTVLPAGVAVERPAGSKIVMQVHFSPHDDVPEPADMRIGLYGSHSAPERRFQFLSVENRSFTIPAGDPAYQITASYEIPFDIHAVTIGAHMHWLGSRAVVDAHLPTGQTICLLQIDDWDLKWQGMYVFQDPVSLPAGTIVRIESTYDNSEFNPRNPSYPPHDVSYGEEASSEMSIGYLGYTLDAEKLVP